MKVVVVHNRYRSGTPSGENRVVDQENAALSAAGHEVIRFERSSDEIASWPAVKKATMPARVVWSGETRRDLTAVLRACRPDVVHVHNTFPLMSSAVLYACRDAAIPVVTTLHNYRLACVSGDFFRNGAICHDCAHDRLPIKGALRGCYRSSRAASLPTTVAIGTQRSAWRSMVSAYVFISASQRDLLSGLDLAQERVFVAHNLVPRRSVPPAQPEHTVLYAGRLDETKGISLLMNAWDRYSSGAAQSKLCLVIAGAGSMEQDVAAWASTRPSVTMLGQVSSSRCLELMSRARAVLVPSVWEETFGLVAVEAMAAGVPPIAAGHGSLVELIDPGVDGVLFAPNDPAALALAIGDVAARPELYAAYGRAARESYEQRFNPERSLERLIDIYRFAIAHPV
jgi:glycosyltransferase involved in cell wall biosynthesis